MLARVGATTHFGSTRALGVLAAQRDRWLAVTEAGIGHNRVVWVDARAGGLRYERTKLELVVDLSDRTLTIQRGATVLRQVSVGVGRPGSETPTGRFAVTDKRNGGAYSVVTAVASSRSPRSSRTCPRGGAAATASPSTALFRRATSGAPCLQGAFMRATPTCAT